MKNIFTEALTYSSAWICETMKGHATYLHYIGEKFKQIKEGRTPLQVDIITIREALHPQFYAFGLLITQDSDVKVILSIAFKGDLIDSMSMTDPDLYTSDRQIRI